MLRKMGLLFQKPDHRDKKLSLVVSPAKELPPNVDLSGVILPGVDALKDYPGVYDQGDEGSCTGNGGAGAIDIHLKNLGYPWPHTPARNFIYYNTREIEGSPANEDSGATIRGTFQSITKYGACPEDGNPKWSWPYDTKNFAQKPIDACYNDARLHVVLTYEAVPQTEDAIKSTLAQGVPIVIGFTVHNSFMTDKVAKSGIMPMPSFLFDPVAGGHCIVWVGYLSNYKVAGTSNTDWIICRNSWGKGWGLDGHFLMPLKYALDSNLASDFWAVHSVGFARAA